MTNKEIRNIETSKKISSIINSLDGTKIAYYKDFQNLLLNKKCPYAVEISSRIHKRMISGINIENGFLKRTHPIHFSVFAKIIEDANARRKRNKSDNKALRTENEKINVESLSVDDLVQELRNRGYSGVVEIKKSITI